MTNFGNMKYYFLLLTLKRTAAITTMITSHQKLAEFRMLNMPNIEAESSIFIGLIIPLKKKPEKQKLTQWLLNPRINFIYCSFYSYG